MPVGGARGDQGSDYQPAAGCRLARPAEEDCMIGRRSKPGAQREFVAVAHRPTVLYSLASQRLTARALLELRPGGVAKGQRRPA